MSNESWFGKKASAMIGSLATRNWLRSPFRLNLVQQISQKHLARCCSERQQALVRIARRLAHAPGDAIAARRVYARLQVVHRLSIGAGQPMFACRVQDRAEFLFH